MDKIAGLLEKFAGLVGVQVERLWPQMVRVYWIQNVVELLLMPLVVALLLYVGVRFCRISVACFNGDHDNEGKGFLSGIAGGAFCIGGSIICLVYVFTFGTMLAALWYPEATYVNSLLKAARP